VECVKALESAAQDFLIGYSFSRPAFKNAIDSNALSTLELIVIEIGVVNHLSNLADDFVLDSEAFQQCFERAVFALRRELISRD
jgi:hypothetical protein